MFVRNYCALSPLVPRLIVLVKYWAKRRGINNPARFSPNSYVYTLLVIFYLIQQKILPAPVMDSDSCQLEKQGSLVFPAFLPPPALPAAPSLPLSSLLMGFFRYFALEFPYDSGCAGLRKGAVIPKEVTKCFLTNSPMHF